MSSPPPSRPSSTARAELEHHRGRGAPVVGEPLDGLRDVRGQGNSTTSPRWLGADGRGRSVGSQAAGCGTPGQFPAPVGGLGVQHTAGVVLVAEQFALPQGVVDVLDGQLPPVRGGGSQAGRVGRGHVAGERGDGLAVDGDVVDDQRQQVLLRPEPQQRGAGGDLRGEVGRGSPAPPSSAASAPSGPVSTSGVVRSTSSAGGTHWYGVPSSSPITVRSTSCRATTSRSASRSAATSRVPRRRRTKAWLSSPEGPSKRSTNHSRVCAYDSGTRSGRVRAPLSSGRAGPPAARCPASRATVGASRTPSGRRSRRPVRHGPG
ncbi:hypothetical protein STENM327S_07261 [Streptomyces tendae]